MRIGGNVNKRNIIFAAIASAALASCSGGSTGPPSFTQANPASIGKLQFAVGTANIYGTQTGLNVVSTFRQANGKSAVGADTPSITGPFTFTIAASTAGSAVIDPFSGDSDAYSTLPAGPSNQEVSGKMIAGTPQTVRPGTPSCDGPTPCPMPSGSPLPPNTTTFGQAGGVFGIGLQPANSTINTTAASYVPYSEPLYDTSANAFYPYGGPPAFDPDKNGMGTRDGLWNLAPGGTSGGPELGMLEGLTTFAGVAPSAGTYTLSVAIQTQGSNGTISTNTVSATANLGSTAKLGTATAPALTFDGNGGASFTIGALPTGATEAYVQITDWGPGVTPGSYGSGAANCQAALGTAAYPVYYTIHVTAPGAYTLPDTDGPNTNTANGGKSNLTPSPSICTAAQNNTATSGSSPVGDTVTVQLIGFDYPAYGITYASGSTQTPALTGSSGQADITISAPATQTSP
jgi:hypothetical protein